MGVPPFYIDTACDKDYYKEMLVYRTKLQAKADLCSNFYDAAVDLNDSDIPGKFREREIRKLFKVSIGVDVKFVGRTPRAR